MISKRLHYALNGIIEKWSSGTILMMPCFDDGKAYKRANGPLVFPISSIGYMQDNKLEFSLHGAPIVFAIKMEDKGIMHIALVNVRTTPNNQPFILPSQSECRSLNSLMSMVFSGLRTTFMNLSDTKNAFGGLMSSRNLNLIVSIGYVQISTSLTSKEFVPVDMAQGITIDYVADTTINECGIVESIKAMNQEYNNLCAYLMERGKI